MIASSLGAVHVAAALVALALGAAVLGAPKGTLFHRTLGAGYVAAMVILNLSALAIYRLTHHVEPFHLLALLSLATIIGGVTLALRRQPGWLLGHYWNMAWSYVGLLAAACGEIIIRLLVPAGILTGPWEIIGGGAAIAVVFVVLGLIVLPRFQSMATAGGPTSG